MSIFSGENLLFEPAIPDADALNVVFAFPNEYSVGITSLGYQIIWSRLALRPDINVSRMFTDGHERLPQQIELVGFSFSWELDYVNILNLLESLNVPLYSRDRNKNHPLIFGGGPVLTANPEPFALFFDVILLGDGEILLDQFLDAYQQMRKAKRSEQLIHLATFAGIYVPSLYQVDYISKTDAIASIVAIESKVPSQIKKQTYQGEHLSSSTVVTEKAAWENIFMVEVVRSCPEMCRFCLASYLTLPFRAPGVDSSLIPAIERGLKFTNRLGLLGASVTQHPEFDTLLEYLNGSQYDHLRLSLSSVRTNTLTEKLASTLARRDSRSVTIAIESGSARLRRIINKKLEDEEILQAATNAVKGGLKGLKLYGMVGLPGEQPEDLIETITLLKTIKKNNPTLRLTLGCSTFVPKAHTPFQWDGVRSSAQKNLKSMEKELRQAGIEFRPESYNWSVIQSLISRGDRRLAPLLELTRSYGDSLGSFKRAFKQLKGQLPELDYYVHRNWQEQEILPWSHLLGPLPQQVLLKHRQEASSHF